MIVSQRTGFLFCPNTHTQSNNPNVHKIFFDSFYILFRYLFAGFTTTPCVTDLDWLSEMILFESLVT